MWPASNGAARRRHCGQCGGWRGGSDGSPASADLASPALLTTHDPDQLTDPGRWHHLPGAGLDSHLHRAGALADRGSPSYRPALAVNAALPRPWPSWGMCGRWPSPSRRWCGGLGLHRWAARCAGWRLTAGRAAGQLAGRASLLAALQDSPLDWAAWLPQAIGEALVLGARLPTCPG